MKTDVRNEGDQLCKEQYDVQNEAYCNGTAEVSNVETEKTIEQYMKNKVYPSLKFFSDADLDYGKPNFVLDGQKRNRLWYCAKNFWRN